MADLVGVTEAAPGDLILELLDLVRGEVAGVALVKQSAQGVEPLVAEDAEPFAQLGETDARSSATSSRDLPEAMARTAVRRW